MSRIFQGITTKAIQTILSGLINFSFRFERYFPQIIRLFLYRQLVEYREKGFIHHYDVDADWKDKYHYSFQIDLFLGGKEVETWLQKREE